MKELPTDHPKERTLEFNYIADGIYVGTNVCCQAHFNKELADKGITEDISLEAEQIDSPFGVNSYLWIPVVDHTPPNPGQLDYGAAALQTLVTQRKKVYVHCKNGHGRAPTLVAAYLIRAKDIAPKEAVALIRKQRPSIHLEDSQVAALEAYSASDA